MSVSEAWQQISEWIKLYIGNYPALLIMSLIAFIYLLISNKSVRKNLIIPILLLIPIIINPILYKYLYKDQRYWRFFWIFPEAGMIGLAFADISVKLNRQWVKCLSLVVISALIVFMGRYAFSPDVKIPSAFQPTENIYKVSAFVKEQCDIILADNPKPKCIFQDGECETRQYCGDIEQLYGRDISGYILPSSAEARNVHEWWYGSEADQEQIFQFANEAGYTHICCRTKEQYPDIAKRHGFSLLAETDGYSIFHRDEMNIQAE